MNSEQLRILSACVCVLVSMPMAAWPQALDTKLWGTDGTITGIARSGNTIYVAGGFVLVGPNTGSFVPISRADGNIGSSFAKVAGTVRTAVSDAAGGWFLGGYFVGVRGLPRSGLAHVMADGTVSAWNPGQDGDVEALALHGDTLYVGGSFTHVGGAQRNSLAALDALTGKVLDWTPEPDGKVRALLVTDSSLIVGGEFSHIGGLDRNSLAELGLTNDQANAFNPNVTIGGGPGSVRTLVVMDDILYFGGLFALVGDQFRLNAAAIDFATAQTTDWNPRAANCNCNRYDGAPFVSTLVAGKSSIYAAGHFSTIQFQDRGGLAELDLSTGAPTPWDPKNGPRFADYAPRIEALALTDSTVYVGGGFDEIGGRTISYLAEVDRNTALATTWNPRPDFPPEILAVRGGTLFAGGKVGLVNCVSRRNLAAFDATTGKPTKWDPNANGQGVSDVLLYGGSVYVAGAFSEVGGQPRLNLAALDPETGSATSWVADTDGPMRRLAIAGNRLFASGYFSTVGGIPRKYLAAFGLPTGELDSWDLNLNSEPLELASYGDTLFIGGSFTSVGGLPRNYVAAVDAAAGTVLDWAPSVDNAVQAIALKDETVYLGGVFHSIDGLPRERLGAVSASTGAATSWVADAANLNPFTTRVYDLALVDSTLYVAGSMDSIAGVSRAGLAALDAATGRVLDWNPSFGGATWTYPAEPGVLWRLAVDQGTLYAGGRFGWVESSPVGMFTAYSLTPGPDPPHHPTGVALAPPAPNPAQLGTTLRFSLPSTGVVDLTVFDVHGRQVASPIPHQLKPAGDHEVSIRTSDWPAGFYFCRLEIAGTVATRKFVVLK